MKNEIKSWIQENKDEIGFNSEVEIVDISSGESNHTFEVISKKSEEIKVLRTSFKVSKDRINHESQILDFLKKLEIEDVPRKLYYIKDSSIKQPILVETHIGEEDIDANSLNSDQVKDLAEMLAKIHSVDSKKYNRFMDEEKPITSSLGYEFREDFKKYSKKPFEEYKELVEEVDERVLKFYNKQKALVREAENTDEEVEWRMCHGDISDNLRVNKDGSLSLVDWELARPGIPRFELIYMFKHSDFSKEEQENFLKEYRSIRETSSIADKWSSKRWKFLAFNDMIWAAKRKEKLRIQGEEYSKYEELFEERLKELQELYNNQ